ncbi:MAG: hypothetical protein ABSG35_20850 [Syntrophobacteraceae bacterium]
MSINGYLNDQYVWYDSNCQERSVALALNDTVMGGNAKQFTYTPFVGGVPISGPLTVNPGAQAGGFGYVVAHLANPSFANAYGADDSPLGSSDDATYEQLFLGSNHAVHQYTLNYVRYGMTSAATTAYLNYYAGGGLGPAPFLPWDWLNTCPVDSNCQYVTVYNMPVTIQWMFATGRNYPVWSVTFDLSQATDYAVKSDFRAPYGDMMVEGGDGSETVGGVGWGDEFNFFSIPPTNANLFTMNNTWDYSSLNGSAPYDYLWTSVTSAEMGLAGTQLLAQQNAGGYTNQGSSSGTYNGGLTGNNLRGATSAQMGPCNNDGGNGTVYTHLMPCMSDWAYQLMQYSLTSATTTTNDKRLAWGADWGSLGYGSLTTINGYTVSGWPKVSYSVYVVLDNHANNPTKTMAEQAQTINLTSLTASVGSVITAGPTGVGDSTPMTYIPAGYSPIFSTWEVNASGNQATLTFKVSNTAPSTLNTPVIVVHNYTASTTWPTTIKYDGNTLNVNEDYFLSLRPDQSELWITLNKNLAGTHTVQILNSDIIRYMLWAGTGGSESIWTLDSSNNYSTSTAYGPYSGWTPVSYSINPTDGTRNVLWAGTGGYASIWTLGVSNNFTSYQLYGPYSGWTPVSYSINPTDGTRNVLWAGTGGYASIWTLDGSNNFTTYIDYGPYSGWTPVSYSINPTDGTRTLLWAGTGGYASIWTLDGSNNFTTYIDYGPYSGWTPVSYSINPTDGTRTLLWAGTGGYASIWTFDSSNNYTTYKEYGPYSGWTPVSYSYNSDGTRTLLWAGTGGYASIWTLGASNNSTSYQLYGPYIGWTPVQYQ